MIFWLAGALASKKLLFVRHLLGIFPSQLNLFVVLWRTMSNLWNLQAVKSLVKTCRSSHGRCFVRKGVPRNFSKFTGKHPCQSLFFNKVAGVRPATLKKTLAPVFSCEIAKNTFFTEHQWTTASPAKSWTQYLLF